MFLRHAPSHIDAVRRDSLGDGYILLADGVHLAQPDERLHKLLAEVGVRGIYMWTVRPGPESEEEHVVYVGRTNSLARRVSEYLRGFQPHSVNDFKLKVFQNQLLKHHGSARLALYFKKAAVESLPQDEKKAISVFEPILNKRLKTTAEAQAEFRQAFENYYYEGFKPFLPATSDA